MDAKLSRGFRERVNKRFSKFEMRVGILNDGPHREAQPAENGLKSYAGGPVRAMGKASNVTIAEVSERLRVGARIPYLTQPFRGGSNADILAFSKSFFKMASTRSAAMIRRCENLMQAIVRNPILRGDYGDNSRLTATLKGFNRLMFDTGQFFKAIKASIKVKP